MFLPKLRLHLHGISFHGQSFNIYPNPLNNLAFVDAWEVESHISVVNLSGLEMLSTLMDPFENTIDLNGLPEGVFIITRQGTGRVPEYAKIVKLSLAY